VPPCAL